MNMFIFMAFFVSIYKLGNGYNQKAGTDACSMWYGACRSVPTLHIFDYTPCRFDFALLGGDTHIIGPLRTWDDTGSRHSVKGCKVWTCAANCWYETYLSPFHR